MTSALLSLPIFVLIIFITFHLFWKNRDNLQATKNRKICAKINAKFIATFIVIFPYIITCLILYSGGKKPIIHFKKEGFKFSLQSKDKSRVITIGGSKEKNDIYIREFPENAFYIKETRDELFINKGDGYKGFEIVMCSGKIPGLVALKDGSEVTIINRSSVGKSTLSFNISQGGVAGLNVEVIQGKSKYKIPRRLSDIPFMDSKLPLFALPNAYSRVFPLENLISEKKRKNGQGYKSSIIFGDFEVENKEDEIFEPFLLTLDDGVSVDGKQIKPFPVNIKNGASLSFLKLHNRTQPRLMTVMKIKEVKIQDGIIEFIMAHPDIIAAKLEQKYQKNRNDKFVIGNSDNLIDEKIILFENLSDTFSKYFAFLELNKESIKVTGPFLNKKYGYNEVIEIGKEDKFLIKILRIEVPWRLITILLFTALSVIIFSIHLLNKLKYVILFGSIAILTTNRVLFAYTASMLPPFNNEVIPFSLFLLTFAPSLIVGVDFLVKAIECRDSEFSVQSKNYIIKGIAALVFTLAIAIPQMAYLSSMLLLGAIMPILILAIALGILLAASFSPLKNLSNKLEKFRDNCSDFLFKNSTAPLNIILIVFIIGRSALLMTGNKESIYIGARFSISIITVPLFIFFIALCTSRFVRDSMEQGIKSPRFIYRYIGYTFGFSAIFFGFAFITNDLGQMIFSLPISIFLTGVMLWNYKRFHPKIRYHLFILATPLVLIILFLLFPTAIFQIIEGITPEKMVVKEISETEIVSKGQYVLRLMQYMAPTHLQEIGSIDSESIAQHFAIMSAYTRRGFWGEGYMNVKVHPSLYRTCLNDNVSAVYIFSQFGVLGIITLILTYCILVLIGYKCKQEIMDQENPWRRMISALSFLSILVITVVSLYMIGANCHLLLFTGRNLYFLGLNSMSDIFESCILLGFITVGIATNKIYLHQRSR